jgi:alkylated DNA repair dioxygenase AlkB
VIADFAGPEEQHDIERWILTNFVWQERRQGARPPSEEYPHDGPIPVWAARLGDRMVDMGVFEYPPSHVLVRRYARGVGLEPHIDRAAYGPVVAGLTLASSRMLQLTRPRRRSRLEALLLPGDLYVMTGAARYRWRHGIPATGQDEFCGVAFPRSAGFSVTWRQLPSRSKPANAVESSLTTRLIAHVDAGQPCAT